MRFFSELWIYPLKESLKATVLTAYLCGVYYLSLEQTYV